MFSTDIDEVQSLIFDNDEGKNEGILFIGGIRMIQVYTCSGSMLGQFGDQYTWNVDNPLTYRSNKPQEKLSITTTRQPWKRQPPPPPINQKDEARRIWEEEQFKLCDKT